MEKWQRWSADRVVHEEAVVEIEGVVGGVVNQVEQRLEAARVNERGRQVHAAQYAADCVRYELRARRYAVVLLAAHLHHPAPLPLKELHAHHTSAHWFLPIKSSLGWRSHAPTLKLCEAQRHHQC